MQNSYKILCTDAFRGKKFILIRPPFLYIRCIVFGTKIREHTLREYYTRLKRDYLWLIDMKG
jgi:hypothetical protein